MRQLQKAGYVRMLRVSRVDEAEWRSCTSAARGVLPSSGAGAVPTATSLCRWKMRTENEAEKCKMEVTQKKLLVMAAFTCVAQGMAASRSTACGARDKKERCTHETQRSALVPAEWRPSLSLHLSGTERRLPDDQRKSRCARKV
jgi:hypothetical protein